MFATNAINSGLGKDASGKLIPLGWVDGTPRTDLKSGRWRGHLVGLAIVGTLVILKAVDLLLGVRVNEQYEIDGLDLSMHGEEGYNLEG